MPVSSKLRKSISLRPRQYLRLRAYCKRTGRSMASVAEECIDQRLDELGEPDIQEDEAREHVRQEHRRRDEARAARKGDAIRAHFTF